MKNVTSIKTVKTESPKTPGGISKSLLTPCRRLGLSRNWKKAGPSPFVSPLAGGSTPCKEVVQPEKKVSRKRKERVETENPDEENQCTPETPTANDGIEDVDESVTARPAHKDEDLSSTPIRHIEVPRKKKSKTLLSALKSDHPKEPVTQRAVNVEDEDTTEDIVDVEKDKKEEKEVPVTPLAKSKSKGKTKTSSSRKSLMTSNEKLSNNSHEPLKEKEESNTAIETQNVVTPVLKSRSKPQDNTPVPKTTQQPKSETKINNVDKENVLNADVKDKSHEERNGETEKDYKPRSPNELTKECIVVIQKKIFKTDKKQKGKTKPQPSDSDSDDVPLGQLNKENAKELNNPAKITNKPVEKPSEDIVNLVDEEDFVETKPKVKKLEDKSTSIGGLKKKPKNKQKLQPKTPIPTTDFDDEDDFDFDNKKTILIRKTYEKVNKPQKAKSTGSITQKDIDELRARIEVKKKMLLARAVTEDTEELRSLIKKWQRGCQDALMELMELMKTKFADRPNMDYSEMLSMLKIPQTLVGYDAENDCFVTPDDATIVLSKFNDL
ncbi:hypothetical protein O0L34_g14680 [Tuta absoluta]|nr:hypothetical protein O0L34_g14680 [Tuta absoluta]